MKKSRFTEDQMVRIPREADQTSVAAAAKAHAVSEQTIYTWRKRYGELEVNDVRHLRAIEKENARLKKLLAERDLEIEIMKEVNAKKWSASARRDVARYIAGRETSLDARAPWHGLRARRSAPSLRLPPRIRSLWPP